ncbi:MAG TPA: DUF642 domain-containing protein [Myxococcota bacterium]|nr:DUF642 domain-containing protein [Myxococcota bacterium]
MHFKLASIAGLGLACALGCANAGQVLNTALATALAAPGALAQPVFQESFEAPATANYTVVRAGQSFTTRHNTWSVTGGSVDVVNARVRTETVAADGTQLIDLAGSPGAGVMSASFPTSPGQRYTLSFAYARNNGIGANPALARVDVIGAATLLRADLRHAAPAAFNVQQRFSRSFVADAASTSLRFTSLVGGNAGVTIDAIRVTSGSAATSGASTANLVTNGGFEQPVVPNGRFQTFATGQSFPGWQVIGAARGNVAPISGGYRNAGITFGSHGGAQWLDMTGLSNSATGVQQTVRTQPGARYVLTFFVGNVSNPRGSFGTTSAIEVLVDGKSAGVFRNDGAIPGAQHWRELTLPITAAGSTTRIAFINRDAASDNSCGLDDVSLVPSAVTPS